MSLLPPKLQLDDNTALYYAGDSKLGQGAFGTVLPCMMKETTSEGTKIVGVAVKCASSSNLDEINMLKSELQIWRNLPSHPNVLQLLRSHVVEPDSHAEHFKFYFVTIKMKSDLKYLIFQDEKFAHHCTYQHLLRVMMQISKGLKHLHEHNIIHFDLKPGNVLLSGWEGAMLMDFGHSKAIAESRTSVTATMRGTFTYMAPEVLRFLPVKSQSVRLSNAVDIFSFGVLMWVLCNRRDVGSESNWAGRFGRNVIWNSTFDTGSVWCAAPHPICDLIESCLSYDGPSARASSSHGRPSAANILDTLGSLMAADWSRAPVPCYRQEEPSQELLEFVAEPTLQEEHSNSDDSHSSVSLDGQLVSAAALGDISKVKVLLDKGANTNTRTQDRGTSLISAAEGGHAEVVDALLRSGADPNARRKNGWTALRLAAEKGYPEVIESVIHAGADPNALADDGGTALISAADLGQTNVAETLIRLGADVNVAKHNQRTALSSAVHGGHSEMVEVLIRSGVLIDSQGEGKKTALWVASYKGNLQIVKALIEAGADVNIPDKHGKTPLKVADEFEESEIADVLRDAGGTL